MNLRAMETLRFFDSLLTTGSASFMNCRSFSRIELTRGCADQGRRWRPSCAVPPQELTVTVHDGGGGAAPPLSRVS